MATTATAEEIAEARRAVEAVQTAVVNTRYELSYSVSGEDDEIDRLAAELTDALRDLRHARRVLGDMEAGAGDWDADEIGGLIPVSRSDSMRSMSATGTTTLPADLEARIRDDLASLNRDADNLDRLVATTMAYAEKLMSGTTFALAANSNRSVTGYHPPATTRSWGRVCEQTARMAQASDALAVVARHILAHLPLYGTDHDIAAAWQTRAGEALAAGFDDVHARTGPEPVRHSDAQRDFTLNERLLVHLWGCAVDAKLQLGCLPAPGWCATCLARVLQVRIPEVAR